MADALRFPAEWEPQSAILIAWPTADTDWAERLEQVENAYIQLVAAITRFQPALIIVADEDIEAYAEARLRSNRIDMARVRFVTAPYDDTWLRDSGPICLVSGTGHPAAAPTAPARSKFELAHDGSASAEPRSAPACAEHHAQFTLLDFRFTGWGGKFESNADDALVKTLASQGVFGDAKVESIAFALEGGAIDTDGQGTLLTTWQCLHERHPGKTRQQLNEQLLHDLRQQRVLWLDHGYLEGDDTDAHVDTLARFAAPDAIVYQACNDPDDSHFAELQAMEREIAALRTVDGQPYRRFPLPWARPILDEGRRLAASYANFLIVNGAVLMPSYGDPADARAKAVMQQAFPDREIVQVDCRPIIWQNGSLHCLTMQLPAGLLRYPRSSEAS